MAHEGDVLSHRGQKECTMKRKVPDKNLVVPATQVGRKSTVHYSLNRCRVDKPPVPGERCFVVSTEGRKKVVGYAGSFDLKGVKMVVRPGGVKRIRDRGEREVVAWYEGDLAAVDRPVNHEGMKRLRFNPFKDTTFKDEDGHPVEQAARAVGTGRATWAQKNNMVVRRLDASRTNR